MESAETEMVRNLIWDTFTKDICPFIEQFWPPLALKILKCSYNPQQFFKNLSVSKNAYFYTFEKNAKKFTGKMYKERFEKSKR